MKKMIATLHVSYPIDDYGVEDKINQFLKKNYKNFQDNGYMVGGGTVDLSYTFKKPVQTKKEFAHIIKPFMDKFASLDPEIEYEPEESFLESQTAHQSAQKQQKRLKKDLVRIYVALRDKYQDEEEVLEDLDHIFKECLPPAWQVDEDL
jgi:hypothetical protein